MKEIYRKTSISSFIIGSILLVYIVLFYLIGFESFSKDGGELITFGLLALFSIGAGFRFKSVHEKLIDGKSGSQASTLNLEELNELNLKQVPALLLKLYNVDSNGNPLLIIEPSKGRLSRWLTFFKLFEKGFIIPVHYDITDMDGTPVAMFTIKDNVKQYELTLKKPNGVIIGTYIQQHSKSVMKNRGVLYKADGSVWRELEAQSMAGDIDVKDEDGRMTARYRFGIFPYAMKPAFQSTAHHEHVSFGSHITSDEKLAYTMLFFFWLKG